MTEYIIDNSVTPENQGNLIPVQPDVPTVFFFPQNETTGNLTDYSGNNNTGVFIEIESDAVVLDLFKFTLNETVGNTMNDVSGSNNNGNIITNPIEVPIALETLEFTSNSFTAKCTSPDNNNYLFVSEDNFLTILPGWDGILASAKELLVTGLTESQTYQYRWKRSLNGIDFSEFSNTISVTTSKYLDAPVYAKSASNSATFIMDNTFTKKQALTSNDYSNYPIGITPDGQQIFYIENLSPNINDIWKMDSFGNNKIKLTNSDRNWIDAQVSPDMTKIAAVDGDTNRLYILDINGQNPVLAGNTGVTSGIDWHPDGTKIVYNYSAGIGVLTVSNNTTSLVIAGNAYFGKYSPDGTKILHTKLFSGYYALYSYTVSTLTDNLLFSINLNNCHACDWNFDGTKVICSVYDSTWTRSQLYTATSTGADLKNISNNFQLNEFKPTWKYRRDNDPTVPAAPNSNPATSITNNGFAANGTTNIENKLPENYLYVSRDNFSTHETGYNGKLILAVNGIMSHQLVGLTSNTEFKFRWKTKNLIGYSGFSSTETVMTSAITPPIATAATGNTSSQITANCTSGELVNYLYVSTSIDFSSHIPGYNGLVVNGNSSDVIGLLSNTTIYYRWKAWNGYELSDYSNVITTATTVIQPPTATAATLISLNGFTANGVSIFSQNYLYVSLDNFSTHVSGYNGLLVSGTPTQIVSSLIPSTEYKYRWKAWNGYELSDYSNVITVTTDTPPVQDPVATNATSITGTGFTANATSPETTHYLYVSTDINFSTHVSGYNGLLVSGTATQVVINLPRNSGPYYYRWRSYNGSYSNFSNIIKVNILTSSMKIFFSYRPGSYDNIYMMDIDGSNKTALHTVSNHEKFVTYHEGTKMLVFSRWDGSYFQIAKRSLDGAIDEFITTGGSADNLEPNISPDGTKVTYRRNNIAYTNSINGGAEVSSGQTVYTPPKFNSDGTKLLFTTFVSSTWQLKTCNLDGTGLVILYSTTDTTVFAGMSYYNYDFTKIYFRCQSSVRDQVGKMNTDGTNLVKLTTSVIDKEWSDVSPDESFVIWINYTVGGYTGPIYKTNASNWGVDISLNTATSNVTLSQGGAVRWVENTQQLDLAIPDGLSAGLNYDSKSMLLLSTGNTIADNSGNGNTGTLTNSPAYTANSIWGRGINFNSANRHISVTNASSYKSSGSGSKLAYLLIVNFDSVSSGDQSFFGIWLSSGYEITCQVYSSTIRVMLSNRLSPDPYIVNYEYPFNFMVNVNYGVAILIDLISENISVIVNQTSKTLNLVDLGATYYGDLPTFKADGGIASTSTSLILGNVNDNLSTRNFRGTIWRAMIIKNSLPSIPQIKTMFQSVGLTAYPDIILPDGIVAGLHYDSTSMITATTTTILDSSGNNNTGTLTGSPVITTNSKWGAGITFAANKYISIPHSISYKATGNSAKLAFIFVVNITTHSSGNRLFSIRPASGLGELSIISGNSNIDTELYNRTSPNPWLIDMSTTANISTGTDYGIAVLIDLVAETITVVINTTSFTTSAVTGSAVYFSSITNFKSAGGIATTTEPAILGNWLGDLVNQYFRGTIWRACIIKDNIPTVQQVKDIFSNMGLTSYDLVIPNGLSAGLNYDSRSMLSATSSTITDSSGNNNTGTLTNSPTISKNSKWGAGVTFNAASKYVSIPHSTSYKISGTTGKIAYIFVVNFASISGTNRFFSVFPSSNYEMVCAYWTSTLTPNFTLAVALFRRDTPNPTNIMPNTTFQLKAGVDYGIAFIVDIENETCEIIVNQISLPVTLNLSADKYTSWASFKSAGGQVSTSNPATLGYAAIDAGTEFFRGTIYRALIIKDNIPTPAQIKTMFANVGLTSNFPDLILPGGMSAALDYNSISMGQATTTTILDKSGNNNTGTINGGAIIATDSKWGCGIDFNAANRRVTIPHSTTYKINGTTGKIAYFFVFRLTANASVVSRFFGIYPTSGNGEVSFGHLPTFIGSLKSVINSQLHNRSSSFNPYLLQLNINHELSLGIDYGIAFLVDLDNSRLDVVINQQSYRSNYHIPAAESYSTWSAFKAAGGVATSTVQATLGNVDAALASQYFQGIIWRFMIVKGTIPTIEQAKQMFANLGLTY